MVQARYSFGYMFLFFFILQSYSFDPLYRYYGSIIPSALNVFSLQGYLILNTIVGGQSLAAVSNTLSWNVGIVIIAVITLLVRSRVLLSLVRSTSLKNLDVGRILRVSRRPLVRERRVDPERLSVRYHAWPRREAACPRPIVRLVPERRECECGFDHIVRDDVGFGECQLVHYGRGLRRIS